MYAIVVPTETGPLSVFLVDIAIYIQIRVYYVRFAYVKCVWMWTLSSQVKECVVFGRPFTAATHDEIIANLHKTAHNLNGIHPKSIVMINRPYTK